MRLPVLLIASAVAALGGVAVMTGAGTAAPAAAPATRSVTIRPVTASGHAASGYRAVTRRGESIDCSFAAPSPGAVSANIEECSPSAAYAIACWKTAAAGHALCQLSPTSHRLSRVRLMGKFAKTAVVKPAQTAPLLIVLTDGTRCGIRDGGAWGTLASHPRWNGSYSCTKHGNVWASPHASHNGVNESGASWTVHTASASGTGGLTVRHIKRAYFVGTAR